MYQACFLSLPGITQDQQLDVVNCINGHGKAYDAQRVNDATLTVRIITIESQYNNQVCLGYKYIPI